VSRQAKVFGAQVFGAQRTFWQIIRDASSAGYFLNVWLAIPPNTLSYDLAAARSRI
jgi:hypothetical protein